MKKSTNIIYWIVTIIFALAMIASGITEVTMMQAGQDLFVHLGYPVDLLILLGVAKISGAIALLQWKFKTVKEWAYAGFTIDFIGASWAHYFVGDALPLVLMPMGFLVVMVISYVLWKKKSAY